MVIDRMDIQVKLTSIIEEIEMQFDAFRAFLNSVAGGIVSVRSDDLIAAEDEISFDHLPEWQQEDMNIAIDVVENFENYIELPTKDEINEYNIMEDFCLRISDQTKQDSLLRAIRGRGAFRRFKDRIIELGIENEWYAYRSEQLKQIAIEWCRENHINYIE